VQDSDHSAARAFLLETYRNYSTLSGSAAAHPDINASERADLGGQLFWAGELDATGQALVIAGNIAGTASLAATSDPEAQRQAVREGIVDFLVNSLDEALRILKNEVRKRATVAVCVGAALDAVEHEMVERGVRPDVFREAVLRAAERDPARKGSADPEADPMSARALVTWHVDRAPALWLPKIDALALASLAPDETIARSWLQRSGRYLGRRGQAEHLVWSNREFASRLFERVGAMVERGELAVSGCIEAAWRGASNDQLLDRLPFGPPGEQGIST